MKYIALHRIQYGWAVSAERWSYKESGKKTHSEINVIFVHCKLKWQLQSKANEWPISKQMCIRILAKQLYDHESLGRTRWNQVVDLFEILLLFINWFVQFASPHLRTAKERSFTDQTAQRSTDRIGSDSICDMHHNAYISWYAKKKHTQHFIYAVLVYDNTKKLRLKKKKEEKITNQLTWTHTISTTGSRDKT